MYKAMAKKKPPKTKKVKVTVEHDGIPEGSVITVSKELKHHYKGMWASMAGSFEVKVQKKYCVEKE